jgi:WD40 repeat protein/Tfp pilus assembly protein PilF
VEFSPDSKRLAVVDSGHTIRILDTESLAELRRFDAALPRAVPAWNPADARQILVSNGSAFRVLDQETGEVGPLVSMPNGFGPVWHPEGRRIAFAGTDKNIRIWDTQQRTAIGPPLEGHRADGVLHAFNRAGDLLVSNDWAGLLRLWDTRTAQQLLSLPSDGHTLQFGPDDEMLAAHTGSGKVRLFRVASGKEFRTLARPSGAKQSGYIDYPSTPMQRNGRLLMAQAREGMVLVDVKRWEELAVVSTPDEGAIAFESSGEALLTLGQNGLRRWPLRISGPDATRIDVGPPRSIRPLHAGGAGSSADGAVVAVANDKGALIWRASENRTFETIGRQSNVRFCAVSPDGRWVATGSGELLDGAGAKVWDAATGKLEAEFPVNRLCRVWFSPDGKWLVTGGGGYRIWAVGSWQEGPALGGSEQSNACAFRQDGQLLAVSDKPGVVRLVEPSTGREVTKLTAPVQSRLWPTGFTPDGNKLIALGTETGTLHVFDLELIRAQLRAFDLDWDDGPSGAAGAAPSLARPAAPLTVHVNRESPIAPQAANPDFRRAMLALRTLQIGTMPHHPEPYHLRAHLHEALGQHQQAIDDFTQALRWQPEDGKRQAHLYQSRAASRQAIHLEADAAADLAKAIALDPSSSVPFNNLAQIYVNGPADLRAPGKALALAESGLRLAPNDWACRNTLGVAHYRLGHFESAVVNLERSLRQSNGERAAIQLYFLAMCYTRLGDTSKGKDCFDQAVRWVPEHPERLPPGWRERLAKIRTEAESIVIGPKS